MSLELVNSGEFKLLIQIMTFVIALIVTHMSMVEWRRNGNGTYKYLALGFGFLFSAVTTMTPLLAYSAVAHKTLLPAPVYVLEHALITAGYIYIAAAFITTGYRSAFIRTNFFVLTALTGTAISNWFIVGLQANFRVYRDVSFEFWIIGLLVFTVFGVLKSGVRMKWGLVLATSLLFVKHLTHIMNTLIVSDLSPVLTIAENFSFVFYFFAVVMTLHREIITDLLSADFEKNRVTEKAHQETIRALINSLEAKDEYTRGHSDRVTDYTMIVGQKMGMSQDELTNLYYGSILHDIGKIGVSEEILNNPFTLRGDDLNSIQKHPEIGATIISSIDSLKHIAPVILYHHERYDGSGYPKGLKGHEIPLHSRIIAISDALDAMLSNRTYRDSLTEEKAVRELICGAGSQFDPQLVKIFLEALHFPVKETDRKILGWSA